MRWSVFDFDVIRVPDRVNRPTGTYDEFESNPIMSSTVDLLSYTYSLQYVQGKFRTHH
jgi:hypothetical protein